MILRELFHYTTRIRSWLSDFRVVSWTNLCSISVSPLYFISFLTVYSADLGIRCMLSQQQQNTCLAWLSCFYNSTVNILYLLFFQQGPREEIGNLGQVQDLIANGHADPMARIVGRRKHAIRQVLQWKIRLGAHIYPGHVDCRLLLCVLYEGGEEGGGSVAPGN